MPPTRAILLATAILAGCGQPEPAPETTTRIKQLAPPNTPTVKEAIEGKPAEKLVVNAAKRDSFLWTSPPEHRDGPKFTLQIPKSLGSSLKFKKGSLALFESGENGRLQLIAADPAHPNLHEQYKVISERMAEVDGFVRAETNGKAIGVCEGAFAFPEGGKVALAHDPKTDTYYWVVVLLSEKHPLKKEEADLAHDIAASAQLAP